MATLKRASDDHWILLVEDSEPDAVLTRLALARLANPPQTRRAEHGREALDLLARCLDEGATLPSVILLDLHMPVLDGPGFLTALRANPDLSHLAVVVLTTTSDPAEVRNAHKLGANAFLVKPVYPEKYAEMMVTLDEFWLQQASLPI